MSPCPLALLSACVCVCSVPCASTTAARKKSLKTLDFPAGVAAAARNTAGIATRLPFTLSFLGPVGDHKGYPASDCVVAPQALNFCTLLPHLLCAASAHPLCAASAHPLCAAAAVVRGRSCCARPRARPSCFATCFRNCAQTLHLLFAAASAAAAPCVAAGGALGCSSSSASACQPLICC
eukprot:360125-Chlamydomonas_euryale.AAC.3